MRWITGWKYKKKIKRSCIIDKATICVGLWRACPKKLVCGWLVVGRRCRCCITDVATICVNHWQTCLKQPVCGWLVVGRWCRCCITDVATICVGLWRACPKRLVCGWLVVGRRCRCWSGCSAARSCLVLELGEFPWRETPEHCDLNSQTPAEPSGEWLVQQVNNKLGGTSENRKRVVILLSYN